MAGDVERRAGLAGIGAGGLGGVLDLARRVHGTGAHQHVVIAQPVVHRRDQLGAAALRADIFARGHEGAGQQAAAGQGAVIAGTVAQPGGVDRPGLRAQDDAVDARELAEFGQADGFDQRALGLEDAGGVLQPGGDIGMRGHVGFVEMAHEADAQPLRAMIQHPAKAARVGGGAAGVARIVSGQHIQQQRVIGHGAGHRPDMIQREGQRKYPPAADQPIGWLQPDNAAHAGRIAHRAAGVGAKRQREHPRRHPRARS